jgi:hypothetical protein
MAPARRKFTLLVLHNQVKNAIRACGEPVFVGDAGVDYLCGVCGVPLCVGMREGDLAGLAFRCACGASNLVPWRAEQAAELAMAATA